VVGYRLQVTVADDIADELRRRAQTAGQPASRVAATLINLALNTDARLARDRAPARSVSASHDAAQPPSWIEPIAVAERRAWRSELWAAVLALCARYPKELQRLEASWWRNRARTEHLAALDAWRRRSTRPAATRGKNSPSTTSLQTCAMSSNTSQAPLTPLNPARHPTNGSTPPIAK
jgi:hypothetical protein